MAIDLQDRLAQVTEEASQVLATIREKGVKAFARPLLMTGGLLAASYLLVYKPSKAKLGEVRELLNAAEATGKFAQSYREMESKIQDYSRKVPKPSDKDGWLFNTVIESARKSGVTLGTIGSQTETPYPNFIVLTIPVSAVVTFRQLGAWLASLEGSGKILHVSLVNLSKQKLEGDALTPESLGRCEVNVEISTIIPKLGLPT